MADLAETSNKNRRNREILKDSGYLVIRKRQRIKWDLLEGKTVMEEEREREREKFTQPYLPFSFCH